MNKLSPSSLQSSTTTKRHQEPKHIKILLEDPAFYKAMNSFGHEKALSKYGLNPMEVYEFICTSPTLLKKFVRRKV